MKKLQLDSKMPLYAQLKDILKKQITEQVWKPGDTIPPESVLVKEYSVSRSTVRQAINELVQEGFLTRQRGRGTFVKQPKLEVGLQKLYSFTEDISAKGMRPESRLLEFDIVVAKQDVIKALNLNEGDLVCKIVRLRLANDEIIMVETTYLPFDICSNLTKEDLESAPLYSILEEKYNISIERAIDYFEPVIVDSLNSSLLDVPKGSAALYLVRIGSDQQGTPIELSQSYVRGDRSRYYVELIKQ
ncbi:GntR family transcriptional regulator [Lederbergia graminis]|uniref:GntR family transcriptional regulator n=1 Tax=Lederbergia graminis TaxID=735518 RepID=A0ABW0LPG4_9BACI